MGNFMMSAARRLLYPFPDFPWPAGSLASKLDAVAERPGLGAVEDVFRDNPAMDRIVRATTLFLDDPEGLTRALERWVANPGDFAIPFDWFRENFDPFADDRATTPSPKRDPIDDPRFRGHSSSQDCVKPALPK